MSTDRSSHSNCRTTYSSKATMFMIENLLHLDNNTATTEASCTPEVNECSNQQSPISQNTREHRGNNDSENVDVDSNLNISVTQKEDHWNDSETKKRLRSESDEDESKTDIEGMLILMNLHIGPCY